MMAQDKDLLFVGMNAWPVMQMMGESLGGYFLLSQAEVAGRKLDAIVKGSGKEMSTLLEEDENARSYNNKVQSAISSARDPPLCQGEGRVDGRREERHGFRFLNGS